MDKKLAKELLEHLKETRETSDRIREIMLGGEPHNNWFLDILGDKLSDIIVENFKLDNNMSNALVAVLCVADFNIDDVLNTFGSNLDQ